MPCAHVQRLNGSSVFSTLDPAVSGHAWSIVLSWTLHASPPCPAHLGTRVVLYAVQTQLPRTRCHNYSKKAFLPDRIAALRCQYQSGVTITIAHMHTTKHTSTLLTCLTRTECHSQHASRDIAPRCKTALSNVGMVFCMAELQLLRTSWLLRRYRPLHCRTNLHPRSWGC